MEWFLRTFCFAILFAFSCDAQSVVRVPSLADVDYLRMYGYLTDAMPGSTSFPPREKITKALRGFQGFSGLPQTGVIDVQTARQMNKSRCGCPDIMMAKPEQPLPFRLGPKWTKTTLTWKVANYNGRPGYTRKLGREETNVMFRRAFQAWSQVTPLKFIEVTDQRRETDLNIFFARGVHGDGNANGFDGQGRVLAHAFFPSNGRIHFDEDENWVIDSDNGIDLFTVAAHEFGHALGLSHSEVSSALMAPFYQGYDQNFRLHSDDIAGIQQLYGAGTPTVPPRTLPTLRPTRPSTTTTTRRPRLTFRPVQTTTTRRPRLTFRPVQTTTTRRPRLTFRPVQTTTTRRPRLTFRPVQTTTTRRPRLTFRPVQTTTTRRPTRPTRRPTRPADCNIRFKGFIRDIYGDSIGFWDRYMAKMTEDGGIDQNGKMIIRSQFPSAPYRPDAVFNIKSAGRVYFIRGKRIWQYKEGFNGYELEGRFWIGGSYFDMPERPRGAIVRSRNEIFVLGYEFLWRWNAYDNTILRGTRNYISNVFRGVPYRLNIDASVMWNSTTAFFFSGPEYYSYNFNYERTRGPFPVGPAFIKGACGDQPK